MQATDFPPLRIYRDMYACTVEPPIKDAPNKGHLLWSRGVLYSEVPLYMFLVSQRIKQYYCGERTLIFCSSTMMA